nr:MAG TPA: protein of unknown function DUF4612 [Bacteriophage sp.]
MILFFRMLVSKITEGKFTPNSLHITWKIL